MADPTATTNTTDRKVLKAVAAAQRSKNEDANDIGKFTMSKDANAERPVDYYVYIHNVSPRPYEVQRPAWVRNYIIPGCKAGQAYATGARIPNVIQIPYRHPQSDDIFVRGTNGEVAAEDLLNPDNLGNWKNGRPYNSNKAEGYGNNLYDMGCFWSLNEIPTEQELANARKALEARYNDLINKANELSLDPRTAGQITPEMRDAANYFGMTTQWNQVRTAKQDCPLCGNPMKAGAAVHSGPGGCNGVTDWDRAIAAGIKTEADRPKQV